MHARALTLAVFAAVITAPAGAQTWAPPPPSVRCPSRWGASDERGAANHMKPATVLRATRLIKTGEIIELGHVLSQDMPAFGTRRFDIHLKRTGGPLGTNKRYTNEELVVAELGHVGTQMDGFPHQGIDGKFYNCVDIDKVATRSGFTRLGIDKVGAIFTRGVLIDVAGLKGVDMLTGGYEITAADLRDALQKQKVALQPGDAALIRTGWSKLWGDRGRYMSSCPGIGVQAAEWLAKQDVILMGSDNWPVEVMPNPDKTLDLPVHQIALVVNGIFLIENLMLEELSAKKAYEFAFLVEPLKIQGGTGSTVAPIALR